MKLTRILPKKLAVEYQKHDLDRLETKLQYYRGFVRVLEQLYQEGNDELKRLESR